MSELKIVSVVNNFDIYNKCIKNNEFINKYDLIPFDNTSENLGIPKLYNSFIDQIKEGDDFWIAFIHQDFVFNENPLEKLKNKEKDSLYGVIGINRDLFYLQFKPNFIFKIYRRCMLGQIIQGEGNELVGNKVSGTPEVKTFDCCCCMIHSSLIFKKKLRFDEELNFHMYVEDLCHSAKKKKVPSKVIQMDCRHLSGGCLNEELQKSAEYVKQKHKLWRISSTCFK